jgi:cytochrome P450 family 6
VKFHALFIQIDAFANNIFRIEVNRWRPLRAKLSPTFSSGKLKNMFYLLKQNADHFGQYLDRLVPEEKVLDCRTITSKFIAEVIGSCIFGIELNAISDDNCEFLKMGRKLMQPRLKVQIKELMRNWPWLFDLIGNFLVDQDIIDYFMQLVMKIINYRLKNNIIRHDFMDILTELKKNPEQVPEMGKPRDRRFSTYSRCKV